MSLAFLTDVGVGRKVEDYMRSKGYNVKSILDVDIRMKDKNIIEIGRNEDRVIITMDKDFGELAFKSRLAHSGILLLRLEDAEADEKVEAVKEILEGYSNVLKNNFSVFQGGKLRTRSV